MEERVVPKRSIMPYRLRNYIRILTIPASSEIIEWLEGDPEAIYKMTVELQANIMKLERMKKA